VATVNNTDYTTDTDMLHALSAFGHGQTHFPVIIDNMMNLELLFWASQNGGESVCFDMAVMLAKINPA